MSSIPVLLARLVVCARSLGRSVARLPPESDVPLIEIKRIQSNASPTQQSNLEALSRLELNSENPNMLSSDALRNFNALLSAGVLSEILVGDGLCSSFHPFTLYTHNATCVVGWATVCIYLFLCHVFNVCMCIRVRYVLCVRQTKTNYVFDPTDIA